MDHVQLETGEAGRDLGSNQSGMRARNERLVLTILRRQGALPKAEIARRTGLSAQTVSVIMRALEADGFLEKGEKLRGKVGQPSVPMRLAPDGAYFFGLKVGRRSAELLLVDFVGAIRARRRVTYRYPTPEGTLAFAKKSVAELSDTLPPGQRQRIAGLGIASPFFLWKWASAIGVSDSDMSAWRDCDLEAEIGALFDFPVTLGNDATCACGAELVFGSADKPPDFLYLYVGYFIGGGVVLNGKLYSGRAGNAAAIGPLPVKGRDGSIHELIDLASLAGLEKRVKECGGDTTGLWEAPDSWNADEAGVSGWLADAAPALSDAIIAAVSIIDFSAILIDGSMPDQLRRQLANAVAAHFSDRDRTGLVSPAIRPGSVGADARALGAASLPLSKRFLLED